MRRVLLVTYHFPPEPSAGSLRPGYLARYLPDFDWEPIVLTRSLGTAGDISCPVVAAPVMGERFERAVRAATADRPRSEIASPSPSLPRRLLRWGKQTISFPDHAAGWILPAVVRGLAAARSRRVDAVLSSALPASVHVVGALLAASLGRPWIADYRDLWFGNPTANAGPARRRFERAIERRLIARAATVTTISQALAQRLEELHGRPVSVIPNARDPKEWNGLGNGAPERFELCYTGSMYDGKRTPELLFAALASLRAEGDASGHARLQFYGPNSDHVGVLARAYGLEDAITQNGTVPRPQALSAQRKASHLLIFLNMDESTSHEMGSKILEYVGARRPILAFGPERSAVRSYLDDRGFGWFASNVDEAKSALRSAYGRWLAGDRELAVKPGTLFEARDLAGAFARELALVASGPR